jgi:hypothetical protein
MISPYLLDFCPVFLLVFSPLETADFFMLFKPLGDGYSLLCSQKQLRGTTTVPHTVFDSTIRAFPSLRGVLFLSKLPNK